MNTATKAKRTRTRPAPQPQRLTESPADADLPVAGESLPGQQTLPMELPSIGPKGELIPRPGLIDWLKSLDLEAFLDDWSIADLKRRIVAKYGKAKLTRVTNKELDKARKQAFDWWKTKTLRPERRDPRLDESQWDAVKRAATEMLGMLQGRTIRQCVRLMRTRVPCSSTILQGLPTRFHVWAKKG